MIELVQQRGIAVVLVGVPRLNLMTSLRGADLYARLAERYGVPLENDAIAEVLSESDLRFDPIHPNARGYERIAAAIRDLLRGARCRALTRKI